MSTLTAAGFMSMLFCLIAQSTYFSNCFRVDATGGEVVTSRPAKVETTMDSQIRYLAIVSEQPETLARFYSNYFSMRELGRSDAGDIALTDGFYNISILKRRDGAEEPGIKIGRAHV